MTSSQRIKMLCARLDINVSELARRTNQTPQNLHSRLNKGKFSPEEMEEFAKALGCKYVQYFELPNGEKI